MNRAALVGLLCSCALVPVSPANAAAAVAEPDGRDTAEVQAALDRGGVVKLAARDYHVGTLYLRSGTTLDLRAGARLVTNCVIRSDYAHGVRMGEGTCDTT